jgi:hypothetical protein
MSATVKNEWSCKSIPPTRVHGEYRDSCTFTAAAAATTATATAIARPRMAQKISLVAVATEVRFQSKASD